MPGHDEVKKYIISFSNTYIYRRVDLFSIVTSIIFHGSVNVDTSLIWGVSYPSGADSTQSSSHSVVPH